MKLSRFECGALSALVVLALINALLLFVHRVMTNGDNLDYLFIASRVLEGHWAEPFGWRFPVGYPYLLAAFAGLGGISLASDPFTLSSPGMYAMKGLGMTMIPVVVVTLWGWILFVSGRRYLAFGLTAVVVTSQHLAPLYSIVGTEPYFIALMWLALLGWEHLLRSEPRAGPGMWSLALFATFFALLFRQIALAIPLGVIFYSVSLGPRRAWLTARRPLLAGMVLLGMGLAMMALANPTHLAQLAQSGGEPTSGLDLRGKLDLVGGNLLAYRLTLFDLLLPKLIGSRGLLGLMHASWLTLPLVLLLMATVAIGLIDALIRRQRSGVTAWCVLVMLGIILIWPYRDVRFFLPLVPAFWFFTCRGVEVAMAWNDRFRVASRGIIQGLLLVFLGWNIMINGYAGTKNIGRILELWGEPAWHPARYEVTGEFAFADHLACGLWLFESAPSNAVIYAEKPLFIALASGRRTRYLGLGLPTEGLARYEGTVAGRKEFWILDGFERSAGYGRQKDLMIEWLQGAPDTFSLVFQAPHGATIYLRSQGGRSP
ncbi:MAG TPA: hypothetical protein PKE55_10045 [Kiritimatiellia bacterium]|nr:hypothetical protein [Kiritimatiellia bacterium]